MDTQQSQQPVKMGPVARVAFLLGAVAIVVLLVVNADTGSDEEPRGSCTDEQVRFGAAEARGDTDAMRQADSRMRNGDCY